MNFNSHAVGKCKVQKKVDALMREALMRRRMRFAHIVLYAVSREMGNGKWASSAISPADG